MSGRCTICDEIFDPSEIAALKCGHTFHLRCVSNWLKNSASCPVCRRPMPHDSDVVPQLFFDYGEDSLVFGASPAQGYSKQVSELSKKVQFLESELSKATKLVKTQDEKVVALEKEVTILTTALSNATKEANTRQVGALKAEIEIRNLRHAMTSLNETNDKLKETNSRLEEELRKKTVIAEAQKNQITTLETESRGLRDRSNELVAEMMQCHETFRIKMEAATGQTVARNAELVAENERLKNDLDKLQTITKLVFVDINSDSGSHDQLKNFSAEALEASWGVMKKKVHDLTTEKLTLLNRTRVLEQENTSLKKGNEEFHALSVKQELSRPKARQEKAEARGQRDHNTNRQVDIATTAAATVSAHPHGSGDTVAKPVTHKYGLRSIDATKPKPKTVGDKPNNGSKESVEHEPKRGGKPSAASKAHPPTTSVFGPSSEQDVQVPAAPKKKRRSRSMS